MRLKVNLNTNISTYKFIHVSIIKVDKHYRCIYVSIASVSDTHCVTRLINRTDKPQSHKQYVRACVPSEDSNQPRILTGRVFDKQ